MPWRPGWGCRGDALVGAGGDIPPADLPRREILELSPLLTGLGRFQRTLSAGRQISAIRAAALYAGLIVKRREWRI